MSENERIEELEEEIRNILDVATGWTRPMTPEERLAAIKVIGYRVLGILEES